MPSTSSQLEEDALRGRAVRYHGSRTRHHDEPWTVRGICDRFDECDQDPNNADLWCGDYGYHRWMLIGPPGLDGHSPVLIHVRRASFTVLETTS